MNPDVWECWDDLEERVERAAQELRTMALAYKPGGKYETKSVYLRLMSKAEGVDLVLSYMREYK